mmetsp:Transcript_39203/g.83919  ORF Transcript_39203/g.83919 Transcript_39203/m.83919 type:complete len:300 (-) Transcript_39203:199-1098(-)
MRLLLRVRLGRTLNRVHDGGPEDWEDVLFVELELLNLGADEFEGVLDSPFLLDEHLELGGEVPELRVTEALLVQVHENLEAALGEVRVEVVDASLLLREEVEHLVVQARALEERVQLLDRIPVQKLLAKLRQELQRRPLVHLGIVQQRLHDLVWQGAELVVEDQGGGDGELGLADLIEELQLPEELAQGRLEALDQEGLLPQQQLDELDVGALSLPRGLRGQDVELQFIVLSQLLVAGRAEDASREDDLEEGVRVPVVVQVRLVDAPEGKLQGLVYVALSFIFRGREDFQQGLGERLGI